MIKNLLQKNSISKTQAILRTSVRAKFSEVPITEEFLIKLKHLEDQTMELNAEDLTESDSESSTKSHPDSYNDTQSKNYYSNEVQRFLLKRNISNAYFHDKYLSISARVKPGGLCDEKMKREHQKKRILMPNYKL